MENNTNDWTIGDHLENFNNPHEVTKAQVGLGNVENVRQYSELNPPPNHINTVCGKGPDANGDIDLVKGDVNLGKVDNVKQYSAKNPPPYPVTSVNGQTGAVNIALPDTSGLQTAINTHTANVCNPHQVTKDQVGLGNVDNVRQYSAQNQPPYPVTSVNGLTGAVTVNVPDISGIQTDLGGHIANVSNPHNVTKAQIGLGNVPDVVPYHTGNKPGKADVGLGNVDNTSDLAKPMSMAMQSALNAKLNLTGGTVTGATNFTGALQKSGKNVATYETGSFNPQMMNRRNDQLYSLTGCTMKYAYGNYTKIGDLVFVSVHISYDLSQNQQGDAVIKLPFKAAGIGKQALSIGTFYDALNNMENQAIEGNTGIRAYVDGSDYILFKHSSNGAAATQWRKTTDKVWFSQVCVSGVFKI